MSKFTRDVAPVVLTVFALVAAPFAAQAEEKVEIKGRLHFENRAQDGFDRYGNWSTGGNNIHMRTEETRTDGDGYKQRYRTDTDLKDGFTVENYDEGYNNYSRPAIRYNWSGDGLLRNEYGSPYPDDGREFREAGRSVYACPQFNEVLVEKGGRFFCEGLTNVPSRHEYRPDDRGYRHRPDANRYTPNRW